MYTPVANRKDDPAVFKAFMRTNPFCILVTMTARGLVATHLPTVLHEEGSNFGTLRAHVARANPQWRDLSPGVEAMAVFTGPQHYISPNWYPGKQIHGQEVPTWNYVAVHAYGALRAVDDPAWLLEHLTALTDQSETISPVPWKVSDAPPAFIAKMSRAIVGLEMTISKVEGRWKLSQNRDGNDADSVMAALHQLATPASETMRDLMEDHRPPPPRLTRQP